MFIEKNSNGNLVFYESERKDSIWGHTDDNNDYITTRSDKKSQIFHLYKNAIALQLELLEFLETNPIYKERNIKVRIEDYEDENFWAIIPIKDFRKIAFEEFPNNAIFNYSKPNYKPYGKQIRVPLGRFIRVYNNQKQLIV